MNRSKIGVVYSYPTEKMMLEVANNLEKEGYIVERGRSFMGSFTVKVIGYR